MSKKDNSKCSCPYKPRKILTSKQAQKQPIGSFYHPTEKTVRSGACPIGYELRKGYERKTKKSLKSGHSIYIDPTCVKDKGLPGKLLPEYKPISLDKEHILRNYGYDTKLDKNNRHKKLLDASKDLTYRSVISRLVALRTLTKKSDSKHSEIYDTNIKTLQDWRIKNPELYKKKGELNRELNSKSIKKLEKNIPKPVSLSNLFEKKYKKPKTIPKPVSLSNLFEKKYKKPKTTSKPVSLSNLFKKKSKTTIPKPVPFSDLFKKKSKTTSKPMSLSNLLKKTSKKPKTTSKPVSLSNLFKKKSKTTIPKPVPFSDLFKKKSKTTSKPMSLSNLLKKTSKKPKTITNFKLSSLFEKLHKKNKKPLTLSNILHKKYFKKSSTK
jgi:hypothetical protein